MIKKFCSFILLFFLICSISGCSILFNSDSHHFGTRTYLLKDQKNVLVINQSKPNRSGKLFILNIQSMKLKPLLTKFEGEFFDNDPFTHLELSSDLILSFRPKNEKYYGIWKFDLTSNQAICLTKSLKKNCYLLLDDRQNDMLFFRQTNDWIPQDLYVMRRNGNDMKLLESDFEVYPDDYGKIDDKTFFFSGTSDKSGGKMLLYDIPKKETTLFSGTTYSWIGVLNQALIAKISSNSVGERYVEITSDGIISSLTFLNPYISDFSILDSVRKNFIYTNVLENKQFQIELVNFDSKKKDVLAVYSNNQFSELLYLNEKANILSFYTEELTPSGSKLFFHKLDIATKKIDSIELNKNATYWNSRNDRYLFCNNIQEDEYRNAIIDTATNQLHLFNERVRIDDLSVSYLNNNEKYIFSGNNDTDENFLYSVDKTGKVEIITKLQ